MTDPKMASFEPTPVNLIHSASPLDINVSR